MERCRYDAGDEKYFQVNKHLIFLPRMHGTIIRASVAILKPTFSFAADRLVTLIILRSYPEAWYLFRSSKEMLIRYLQL